MRWLARLWAWLHPARAYRELRLLRLRLEEERLALAREDRREREEAELAAQLDHERESHRLRQAILETRAEAAELAAEVDAREARARREATASARRQAQRTPPPRVAHRPLPPVRSYEVSIPDMEDE